MKELTAKACLALPLQGRTLIEASAGTGKTYTIGNLYLRMISEGWLVPQILVVTFTVAATDELRGRIRQRLHEALRLLEHDDGEAPDPFLQLWQQAVADKARTMLRLRLALRSMDEAAIDTIHAFCQRALGEHAFHSRQRFDNEMLSDDAPLWQQAVYDWWRSHVYPMDETDAALLHRVCPDVSALQVLMADLHDQTVALLPAATESMAEVLADWRDLEASWQSLAQTWQASGEALYAMLRDSKALARRAGTYKIESLIVHRQAWDAYFAEGRWWQWPDCLRLLTAASLEKHSKKRQTGCDSALNHAFFRDLETWLGQAEAIIQRFGVALAHDVRHSVNQQVEHAKQQQGVMSFHDQLQRLYQALDDDETLASKLQQRFPLAMIDEFQDTDSLQYRIFCRIYQPHHCMMMIGDPKQAIYAFRGGDIFTYLHAASDAAQRWTLATNWRSRPEVVAAVNHLFARERAFVMDGIAFHPVAASTKAVAALQRGGETVAAVRAWRIPPDASGKGQTKSRVGDVVFQHVANDIAQLLSEAAIGEAILGDRPVQADDIAVLVHTHAQAEVMQQALRANGVASALAGRGDVWQSDEARGLRQLLQAVAEPANPDRCRLALASELLGLDAATMAAIQQQPDRWHDWTASLARLHTLWQQQGFMAMFQQMLHTLGVAGHLATSEQAERRLTNVLHLGELLLAAERHSNSMADVLHGFDAPEPSGEKELRLESDGQLVRIVTIHASKGLEYPIVYLPTLWHGSSERKGNRLIFQHRRRQQRCCDLAHMAEHRRWAEEEALAEQVRLLYVALTRAQSHMVLVHGAVGKGETFKRSAAYYLWPDGMHHEHIEEQELSMEIVAPLALVQPVASAESTASHCPRFTRDLSVLWQVSSFTAMTRHLGRTTVAAPQADDPWASVPAGAASGVLLHGLLEKLDFTQPVPEQLGERLVWQLRRVGMDEQLAPLICRWLDDVCHAPLHADGWTLADVPAGQDLREMSFDMPLPGLDVAQLDACLQQHAGASLPPLQQQTLRGYVTGSVDLLLCMDGRYYVVDYKSNRLHDYSPCSLRQSMHEHRYDVQALIYTLAVHRFLQHCLPDYDYDRHMGGVRYLYLRGMRRHHMQGVYVDRFDRAFIDACAQMLSPSKAG